MKNKKIIILGASLVMSLTISAAVTDRVNGREDGKPKTLWVQMTEKAMETLGKTDAAIMPVELTETTKTPVEAPESLTAGKASGGSGAIPVAQSTEAETDPSDSAGPSTSETTKTTDLEAAEALLPEAEAPKIPEGSVPKAAVKPEADAPAPQAVANPEASAPAVAPAPETKLQATAQERDSQPENEEGVGMIPQAASKAEPADVSKGTILQMTSAAENSTTTLQYNYAEDLEDGRGITFGIIGFTTGTHDGNALIRHYAALNEDNSLARFIPALDAIDRMPHTGNDGDSTGITAGLDGFLEAVQNNTDPLFRQAQHDKLDELYWNPALKLLGSLGAKNPLTQAFLYDMVVSHGENGTENFISKASYALGGTPGTGIEENSYLMKLMDLRETYLNNTGNPGADRVAAFRRILDTGNVSLDTPFSFTVYGDTFRIDGNIK